MGKEEMHFSLRRQEMVKYQLRARGIYDRAVLQAFGEVPRERFIPHSLQEVAYDDRPLPIGEGQTISQPFVVAAMLQMLQLRPADRVLEVGVGSGYAAAILGRIVAEVYGIERIGRLASLARAHIAELDYQNIQIREGDGTKGWVEFAPFDAILVSAGGVEIPAALKTQLIIGGRLIIPVGPEPHRQMLVLVTRKGADKYHQVTFGRVAFVPLIVEEQA